MHRSNYRVVLSKKRKGEPVRTAVKQRDTGNVVKPDGRAAKEPEHGGQGRLARIYFEVISKVGGA
jgi:hypothetical protein